MSIQVLNKLIAIYRHRLVLLIMAEKFKEYAKSIKIEDCLARRIYNLLQIHDLDKMINLIIMRNLEKNKKYHKENCPYHKDINYKLENHMIAEIYESLFDYESGRFTKPDKPWNAIEFIQRSGILKEYYPFYLVIKDFLESFTVEDFIRVPDKENVTIYDIIDHIEEFCEDERKPQIKFILEKCL